MNHQPDHDQPRFGDFGDHQPPEALAPTRLSILAIISLITGVLALPICCVPAGGTLFGFIPVVCGLGGLRAIRRSRGRTAGRSLAIAGLVMGLLGTIASTLLWIAVGSQLAKMPSVYTQVLDPDPAAARTVLTNAASTTLGDAQLADFREQFVSEHGSNWSVPVGIWPVLRSFGTITDPTLLQSATAGATQRPVPIPVRTDTGWTYLVIVMEQRETLGSGLPAVADVGFLTADGSTVWLHDLQTPVGPDSQSPPPPGADESPSAPPTDSGRPDPDG